MPLFMDLHIVPGITARGVAQAHVLDLNIQEEFQCSCITYWVDEANNSAFCLIEAPSANAVKELHIKSHGLLPFNIIEVNREAVASFLGRLYDPENASIPEEELNVFNDPAYRCMVFIDILDPILLCSRSPGLRSKKLLQHYYQISQEYCTRFGGERSVNNGHGSSVLCFTYAENAVNCAVEIITAFTAEEREILEFKMSLNGGMPVTSNTRIFGETIEIGENLLYSSKDHNIVIASGVKNIDLKFLKERAGRLVLTLSPAEEKLLNKIFNILKKYSPNENFGIEEFCRVAGLSKSSLNRHLQTLTSRTPNILLKEYRLKTALRYLREGENISNVAFNTGFRSPSYFSKCFREYYHMSPSKYIELLKKQSVKSVSIDHDSIL